MLVHVLACGPSISRYEKIGWPKGDITIGCNGVGLLCPKLDAWIACDPMPALVEAWAKDFKGTTFCSAANKHQFPNAVCLKQWGSQGPLNPENAQKHGFYWHGSVAHAACEVARLCYKADRIVVHGLDYKSNEHCYDKLDSSLKRGPQGWDMETVERTWNSMGLEYDRMGVELLNGNPDSGLRTLPFGDGTGPVQTCWHRGEERP